MEVRREEGVGAEDVLGFEREAAVDEVVVVGADDFVPVPGRGDARGGGEGIAVDEGNAGGGVFGYEVEGGGDAEDAGAEDEVEGLGGGHCVYPFSRLLFFVSASYREDRSLRR